MVDVGKVFLKLSVYFWICANRASTRKKYKRKNSFYDPSWPTPRKGNYNSATIVIDYERKVECILTTLTLDLRKLVYFRHYSVIQARKLENLTWVPWQGTRSWLLCDNMVYFYVIIESWDYFCCTCANNPLTRYDWVMTRMVIVGW